MLIEIHLVQNHAPSNLNRDDTGSPKEAVFGGVRRARISSQCLKRTMRRSSTFGDCVSEGLADRTRQLPALVRDKLVADGIDEELADVAAKKASGFGTKEGKERDTLDTAQTMFLAPSDVDAITQCLRNAASEAGSLKEFEKVKAADLQKNSTLKEFRPITVDIAMFGRMTTSDAFRDVDASVQVAHALSTHKVDHEYDYFTAVDDLQGVSADDEDAGADMIGDVEFNSACYYKYLSIDVDGLCGNLTGKNTYGREARPDDESEARKAAADAVEGLIRAAILVTPSGKQNSFAAHQLPAAVLVEVRETKTPVSYANAFVEPSRPVRGADLVKASLDKLGAHVAAITSGYSLASAHRLVLAPEYPDYALDGCDRMSDLDTMCKRVKEVVLNG